MAFRNALAWLSHTADDYGVLNTSGRRALHALATDYVHGFGKRATCVVRLHDMNRLFPLRLELQPGVLKTEKVCALLFADESSAGFPSQPRVGPFAGVA